MKFSIDCSQRHLRTLALLLAIAPASLVSAHSALFPDLYRYDDSGEGLIKQDKIAAEGAAQAKARLSQRVRQNCVDGLAGDYPCRNIDLQATLSLSQLGGGEAMANDIWGWTDLNSGSEVAIVGLENGTSFVDISNPTEPQVMGFLPSHGGGSDAWRDIKVYQDHAFIVADGAPNNAHGLQVFDLRTLANAAAGSTLVETAHLAGFGAAHNIAINEDTGFAYVVGASQCSGGLYMVDISSPATPQFAGCYSADGYTHDAQCVVYQGPDSQYFNQEICIAFNEDTITVVDVSDKSNPMQLSKTSYPGQQYTHQGWFLDENHSYLIMNDELDENVEGSATTSYLWDMRALSAPLETGRFVNTTAAIDHNLYTKDGLVYESNYRSGLRILDASNISQGSLSELAYFDTIPCSDSALFSGAWSSYIYFSSGNVVVSDIGTGLFIVTPDTAAMASPAAAPTPAISPACNGGSNPAAPDPTPAPAPAPAPDPVAPSPDTGGGSGGGGSTSLAFISLLLMLCLSRRSRFRL